MTFPLYGNLFSNLPDAAENEVFEDLLTHKHFRIERIISTGQATPPGQWFDQDDDEWVALLRGAADIIFEGDAQPQHLEPGDFLYIPARRRHRVEWTDPLQPT